MMSGARKDRKASDWEFFVTSSACRPQDGTGLTLVDADKVEICANCDEMDAEKEVD